MKPTVGQTLREARMAAGLTTSQVAEATRIKVQIVEDLEMGDYSRISALIYAKGFIKIICEALQIQAGPLLTEVECIYARSKRPSIVPEEAAAGDPLPPPPPPASRAGVTDVLLGDAIPGAVPRPQRRPPGVTAAGAPAKAGARERMAANAFAWAQALADAIASPWMRRGAAAFAVVVLLVGVAWVGRRCTAARQAAHAQALHLKAGANWTHSPPEPYID